MSRVPIFDEEKLNEDLMVNDSNSEEIDELIFEEYEWEGEDRSKKVKKTKKEKPAKSKRRIIPEDNLDNSTKLYLKEIGRYKLLTFDEEKELSKKIMNNDKNALDKLVRSNLRLVVKIAKSYHSKEYPLIDIIQDGNIGLIKAAEKYDYRKNVRFSTYASWWIKQTIIRSIAIKKHLIKIPHRKEEKIKKIKKAQNLFYETNLRYPTNKEIATLVNLRLDEVETIMSAMTNVISIETNVNNNGDTFELKDVIGDTSYSPDEEFFKENLKSKTSEILDSLSPKEKVILLYRYGFDGGKKLTLKEMGNLMQISPETVRQLEVKALKKIKNQYSFLRDYITN